MKELFCSVYLLEMFLDVEDELLKIDEQSLPSKCKINSHKY